MADFDARFEFSGTVWEWRGPAPFYFVSVPEPQLGELKDLMRSVTYGWGMIPATLGIGKTEWATSLWPKDGGYVVPLKDKVRKAEGIVEGDRVSITMRVALRSP